MKSVEEIYEEMRRVFTERSGVEIGDGCDMAVRLYAAAAEVQALYCQAEWVLEQCLPQTARGEALDGHGMLRNLTRRSSAKATGALTFSVTTPAAEDREIPVGTVCMTAGGVRFITTAAGVIAAGESSCTVAAEAVEPGRSGNAAAGSVTRMSVPPVGVEKCVNEAAFSGGADEETDEEFRSRVLESFRRLPNGANAAYYELQAENHPGVRSAKAVGRARGIGTVDVYIAAESGVPSQTLLQEVYDDLNAKREIAVDLQVLSPAPTAVDVTAALTVGEGYAFSEVAERAEEALAAFFSADLLGRGITRAAISDVLYHVEGVENYALLSPAADVPGGATALPVLGTVSLTQEG
ncbi:MAG: baseplate J/gp47 family protein [Oscillospiraceae bacterium]